MTVSVAKRAKQCVCECEPGGCSAPPEPSRTLTEEDIIQFKKVDISEFGDKLLFQRWRAWVRINKPTCDLAFRASNRKQAL